MRLYAFIAILVPKLVAMVTALCPLCTKVSQMNSLKEQNLLSQNQTLHGCVAYNWSNGHFWDIFVYFGQNLVAMAMSLRPFQSEMSSMDLSTTKPPLLQVIALSFSRRNAFICIYSNFSPKIGCRGNDPLSLVYRSITDEFHESTNPISKLNSARICCIQLKLRPFLWFLWPILAKIWLPWQRSLDPCNQK